MERCRTWVISIAALIVLASAFVGMMIGKGSTSVAAPKAAGSVGGQADELRWIDAENEMVAEDGVTHLCKVMISPILFSPSGEEYRAVTSVSLYMHTSGVYVSLLESAALVLCGTSDAVIRGGGPFSGEGWEGEGRKMASIAPKAGLTWRDVDESEDVVVGLFVEEL